MRHLLLQAINPVLSLLHSLRHWNDIAAELSERPRSRRYQRELLVDISG